MDVLRPATVYARNYGIRGGLEIEGLIEELDPMKQDEDSLRSKHAAQEVLKGLADKISATGVAMSPELVRRNFETVFDNQQYQFIGGLWWVVTQDEGTDGVEKTQTEVKQDDHIIDVKSTTFELK